MTPPAPCSAGIDVSKDFLDVAITSDDEVIRLPNGPDGWAALAEHLCRKAPERVVVEATGGLESLPSCSSTRRAFRSSS